MSGPTISASTPASNPESLPPFLCVFGPTGTGKTEILLRAFAGRAEVISADSMQVYKQLNIGTAKPPPRVLRELPHHLIDTLSLHEAYDAGSFVRQTEQLLPEIAARGKIPIVSGGTGFYIRALLYGLPEAPPSDPEHRQRLEARLAQAGAEPLRKELEQVDPVSAAKINVADHYRLVRALEVYSSSGRPRSSYGVPESIRPGLRAIVVNLNRPRPELYARINARVETMLEAGLAEEVLGLARAGYSTRHAGIRSIGYKEFFDALEEGVLTPESLQSAGVSESTAVKEVVRLIQRNSRHYAKRQMLFFRSIGEAIGIHADDLQSLVRVASSFFSDTDRP
ncbi:MAG: tRNA (adenosine(37)-N6)-dimethylallyltransferase MiaA [Spirochaetaceae bacterium]|nr:MAG: tRNA (adenosine(37)-N6)-dimethylallyltransferase MiaA [Spirochaetaceae bacterium]